MLFRSKTETGRIPVSLESIPLNSAMEAMRFLVNPLLEQCGTQFTIESCAPEVSVVADHQRLEQVLVNLVSNAAKFSGKGGRVAVRCEVRDHLVAILVEDNGPGIRPDKLEAIFEPFVQLSTGLTRTADGSGLGLPISRELARLMGGDVTVESVEGEGSIFTVTLPLSPPTIPI